MNNDQASCIFCNIVNGRVPVEIVLESSDAICFKDITPQAPHHYLIIPKQHLRSVLDFTIKDDTLLNEVFGLIQEVVKLKNLEKTGFRVVTNTGSFGGQSVDHVHFHLLGGRQMNWPPG